MILTIEATSLGAMCTDVGACRNSPFAQRERESWIIPPPRHMDPNSLRTVAAERPELASKDACTYPEIVLMIIFILVQPCIFGQFCVIFSVYSLQGSHC